MRHERDERYLANEGRFARHVWAGDDPDLLLAGIKENIIGDEWPIDEQRLDNGMAPGLDLNQIRSIDFGPRVIPLHSSDGEAHERIRFGDRAREFLNRVRLMFDGAAQVLEKLKFEIIRFLFRIQNQRFLLLQL